MMKKSICVFLSVLSLSVTSLKAQSCDPWITQAYNELFSETPSSSECQIKNYNNGSWKSYEELKNYINSFVSGKYSSFSANGARLSGDPYIVRAYEKLYSRKPNAWELNIKNYNNGSWTGYAQLKTYIQAYQNAIARQKLEIKTAPYNGNIVTGFFIDGSQVAVNVVAAGGGNVVAAGGANVVAAGGANVVAAGGANVVAAGGGNITVNNSMAGVSFGGQRTVQSAGTRIIPTSGSGAMIIK